jgi:[protein-PII] uridylyltransferase
MKLSGPEYQLDLNPAHRREFVQKCNALLKSARDKHVKDCHRHGGAEASRRYAEDMDAILSGIYDWLVAETRLPPQDYERVAIIAQGGYGRGQLNLYSDIDLFIAMPEKPVPAEQAFVKSFLYVLWDLNKLDLGHATKSVSEGLQAIGTDLDSTTALIQMRLVAGNRAAMDDLSTKLAAALRGANRKWFIDAKVAERERRHEKYGSSVYLLEPNIKDGEGGLRDIHSLQWLAYVLLGSASLDVLVEKGVLAAHELKALVDGMDFILALRTVLHSLEARKIDVLTAEKQPGVAKALGYKSDAKLLAEERMMKDYYLSARAVDRYARKAARVLKVRARSVLGGMFDAMRRRSVDGDYYSKSGVLFLKRPDEKFFPDDPARVMEGFWLAASTGLVMSEELKDRVVAARAATNTEDFRESPRCRDAFMRILGLRRGVSEALHQMHDTGILIDYMPEFEKLFCLVRIDHYHRYTVDEHLIKTVEMSEALVNNEAGQRPELVEAAQGIGRRDLLNLALLLHDIGKGEGHGHVLRGAILSQKMTQRMGLPPEDQEVVRQLILQHLKMVHVSQRRDLDDPHVIRDMANAVPDPELLSMLYVLSHCDTRAVGPNVWTDWKASLMQDLYRKTILALEGKDPIAQLDEGAHHLLVEELGSQAGDQADAEKIENFVTNAAQKYLSCVPAAKMAKHMRMLESLTKDNRIVWEVSEPEGMNYTEITAVSYDVPGFLSHMCGALSSKDINILSVQVYSSKDGYAVDTFQVTDLRGDRLPHGFRLERLRHDLNNVLRGKAKVGDVFPRRVRKHPLRPELTALKPVQVIFDNEGSPNFTLLEVKTYDRPGLLYDVTSTCAELGYYIHLAMITTEAYRVVDVFYITDLENNKLEPPQMKKLQVALEQVIL